MWLLNVYCNKKVIIFGSVIIMVSSFWEYEFYYFICFCFWVCYYLDMRDDVGDWKMFENIELFMCGYVLRVYFKKKLLVILFRCKIYLLRMK